MRSGSGALAVIDEHRKELESCIEEHIALKKVRSYADLSAKDRKALCALFLMSLDKFDQADIFSLAIDDCAEILSALLPLLNGRTNPNIRVENVLVRGVMYAVEDDISEIWENVYDRVI